MKAKLSNAELRSAQDIIDRHALQMEHTYNGLIFIGDGLSDTDVFAPSGGGFKRTYEQDGDPNCYRLIES